MNKPWIKHDLANCNLANGKHIEEHACPPAANTILRWRVWINMDHLPWSYLSESRWQVKRKHIKPCLTTMGSFISPWLKWKMGRTTFVKKIVYDGIDKCPFAGQNFYLSSQQNNLLKIFKCSWLLTNELSKLGGPAAFSGKVEPSISAAACRCENGLLARSWRQNKIDS